MQHTHDGALGLQAPARRISCNGTSQAALVEGAECMTFAVWEGKGDATGTEVVAHHQERAMPKPLSQQATWAPRVSVPPLVALTQPRMAQIGWLLDSYFYRTREDPRGPERTREDRRTREDPRGPERTREDPRGSGDLWTSGANIWVPRESRCSDYCSYYFVIYVGFHYHPLSKASDLFQTSFRSC